MKLLIVDNKIPNVTLAYEILSLLYALNGNANLRLPKHIHMFMGIIPTDNYTNI